MIGTRRGYLDIRRELASDRLRDVQAAFDPLTITRLESTGIDPGWHTLIVGAGRGSLAQWLSGRVGPTGCVLVADDEEHPADANTEAIVHDIAESPVRPGGFDLVHSRHILMTMGDPRTALENMIASLCPGGWLVVEEGDFDEPSVVTREHPAAGSVERVWHAMTAFLSGSMDVRFGSRLPRMGWGLGLDGFHTEATRTYSPGGDAGPMAMCMAIDLFRDQLLGSTALWEDDLDMAASALEDPSFVCGSPTSYAIIGRKPA
jgi:hypothetical protein